MQKNVAGQKFHFSLFKNGARIANPTIAVGDYKVDIDNAGQNNVATPPTSDAAGLVTWLPSQAETNGTYIQFLGLDAAGDQWEPITVEFLTTPETSIETILVDTAEIGVAGAGLTALGDVRLANLNATVGSRAIPGDAMALTAGERVTTVAAVWSAAVRTLTSFGTLVNDLLAALAAYYASLLPASISCTKHQLYLYSYFTKTIARDLTAYPQIYYGVKADQDDTDDEAMVLISRTGGLLRINGAAAANPAWGGLTVGASLVIELKDDAAALMSYMQSGYWMVKAVDAAGNSTIMDSGAAQVLKATVRAIA